MLKNIVNYNPPMTFRYLRSRGTKSPDSFDTITTSYVDICPPIIFVEKKQRQRKKAGLDFHFFILIRDKSFIKKETPRSPKTELRV